MPIWCARAASMRGWRICSSEPEVWTPSRPRNNEAPEMRPLARSGVTWLSVLLVLVAFFVLRWLTAAGAFSGTPANTPGICQAIPGLAGPEDFEVDAAHDAIIVSSTNRRAAKGAPDSRDGLYLLKLSAPQAAPVKLDGTPRDFHPHGISLYRA